MDQNTLTAITAVVGLGFAVVTAVRQYLQERHQERMQNQISSNTQAIKELKNGGTPAGGDK
jgi:hypothetical protein